MPVLSSAHENIESLNWTDFWVVLAVAAGFTGLLLTALSLLTRHSVGIVASVGLMNWLSTYAPEITGVVRNWRESLGVELTFATLLPFVFVILLIVMSLLPRKLVTTTVAINGLALFAVAAVPLALSEIGTALPASAAGTEFQTETIHSPLPEAVGTRQNLPDIIYIVPDRYGSSSVLARSLDHDNGLFLDALEQRGFTIAERARANYLRTRHSLASSMNMQYLEVFLSSLYGGETSSKPIDSLIQDNLVVQRLKTMGYQYVHLGSWWDGTRQSRQSDTDVNFWPYVKIGGEFGRAILARSLAFMTTATLIGGEWGWSACAALKAQLTFLENVGGKDRPTFAFAHVLAPHTPILTDAEGRCIEPIDYPLDSRGITWQAFKKGYSAHVSYINKRIIEIFDAQRSSNANSLIFVIQSDEGPWPRTFRRATAVKEHFDWLRANNEELTMKFGIINALYIGEHNNSKALPRIPNDISPVNNWRLIFGYLEDKRYRLLPNRHFIVGADEETYRSIDITDRLKALPR